MSLMRRLHLDDIVTSFPELGPTVPDGGYSWVVLTGIFLVQMTIPSVLSMYGVVLGYLAEHAGEDFELWNEKIILTPILFSAFWCLADPWTKTVVNMASVPRLVGIIGVILLSTGVIASGYLATGGVGAYLASISAGAVMGIGASFVSLQSDHVLRKYFRRKLLLALTVKNFGTSFGLIFVPGLTYLLLTQTDLKIGLLLMTLIFFPTALGTLTLRSPSPQRASPYRLLLTEEDNELPIRLSPDITKTDDHPGNTNGLENYGYGDPEERSDAPGLFGEGSNVYAYQEPDDDVDLFVNPIVHSSSKWKQQLRALNSPRFWGAAVSWLGVKTFTLFFWILLPPLSMMRTNSDYTSDWIILPMLAGIASFPPSLVSFKLLAASSQFRRIYFGVACSLSGVVMIGSICLTSQAGFIAAALLGGVCVGSLCSCLDLAIFDALGTDLARRSHKVLCTVVGGCILLFCFVYDEDVWLLVTGVLQLFGGFFWASSSIVELIKAKRLRPTHATSRTSQNQT